MASEGAITAKTDLDIVNTALIRLGQNPINAFGQNPGTGLILQSSYNMSRDELLRKQPWSFAKTWAAITSLNQTMVNLDIIPQASSPGMVTFTVAYQLPNDCLRVFRFSPKDAHWRVVGRTIYSDALPMPALPPLLGIQPPTSNGNDSMPQNGVAGTPVATGIEYIRQSTDPQEWDALFMGCFVWKICKELAFGITGLAQAYEMAKSEYDESLRDAATTNGIETWPDPYWNTDLNDVRYGYSSLSFGNA